ncbi:hypothetical protein SD70_02505 [Gordoniibacillus kamchatkensis]|uniref:Rho termination factor N-terminal domain-containing protein n=1 Tax=Gordoniibacillus kamchatkensis TaxID=1590651 RepID=A0ABR5AM02_9BACL|nr:hypothetical protein [Paenibacillus sp. VKM B-2647]KIL42074.1 hypothetical protein SD70_02505 [Paenibacillus sp. VKM B-2647]
MLRLFSKHHKEVIGTVPGSDTPFTVTFDESGHAEVEDEAVGTYLLQLQAAVMAEPSKEGGKDGSGSGGGEQTPELKPEDMNVPQLKKFAKDNGIDLGQATKKDEVLPLVQAYLEQKAKEDEDKAKSQGQGQGEGGGGTGDQQ